MSCGKPSHRPPLPSPLPPPAPAPPPPPPLSGAETARYKIVRG